MTCFGTGLRKLFFVCVIAAFGVIAVSSGFGLGILLAALALVAPYKCKIPHFLPLLLILSTLVHVIAVFAVQTPLESDFAMLYQAAQKQLPEISAFSITDIFTVGHIRPVLFCGKPSFCASPAAWPSSSSSTPCFYPASTA